MQFVGNFVFIFCISAILFFSISVKSDLYLWESAADRGGDPSVLVGAAREQSLFFISCSSPFRPSSMVVAIDRPRQLSYHLKGWPNPYRWVSHLIV